MSPRTAMTAALLLMAIGSAYALADNLTAPASGAAVPPRDDSAAVTKASAPLLAREERTIYFDFNRAGLAQPGALPAAAREQLDDLAALLGYGSRVKGARIIGYTDRLGDARYNELLSRKRAETVARYLVAKGVLNARVADTRWVGPGAPTTECSDRSARSELIECLQQDRRVEIEVDYVPDLRASR